MSPSVETFTFSKEVALADADGIPIREGSVLREINDGEQGVVTCVVRPGAVHGVPLGQIGDISISLRPGISRVTNRYNQWRHVPRNQQTYSQRFLAWSRQPYHHDEDRGISRDHGLAIDGIMSLLPDDIVDWEYGPWPDDLDRALGFLVAHLENLKP